MRRSVTCKADDFSFTLDAMLSEIADGIGEGMRGCVTHAARKSRSEVRINAKQFKVSPQLKGRYKKSWTYRVEGKAPKVSAHVYSTIPGLPHLLEKGHANILGGRDVPAYPHIAPAAQAGAIVLEEEVFALVDGLL